MLHVAKNFVYRGDPFKKTVQDNEGFRFLFVMYACHFKELQTHFSTRNIRLCF
jgi:hypothetical protein